MTSGWLFVICLSQLWTVSLLMWFFWPGGWTSRAGSLGVGLVVLCGAPSSLVVSWWFGWRVGWPSFSLWMGIQGTGWALLVLSSLLLGVYRWRRWRSKVWEVFRQGRGGRGPVFSSLSEPTPSLAAEPSLPNLSPHVKLSSSFAFVDEEPESILPERIVNVLELSSQMTDKSEEKDLGVDERKASRETREESRVGFGKVKEVNTTLRDVDIVQDEDATLEVLGDIDERIVDFVGDDPSAKTWESEFLFEDGQRPPSLSQGQHLGLHRPFGESESERAPKMRWGAATKEMFLPLENELWPWRNAVFEHLGAISPAFVGLFHQNPNGILFLDLQGFIRLANPAVLQMSGYSYDEIRSLHWTELVSTMMLRENTETADSLQLHLSKEIGVIHKNGTFFPVDFEEWENAKNAAQRRGTWIMMRDVTIQKRVQKALAKSEEEFRKLFESSHDGIVYTDASGRFCMANPRFLEMFGFSLEELRQLTFRDISLSSGPNDDELFYEAFVKDRTTVAWEREYVRKNGDVVPVVLNGQILSDEGGENFLGVWSFVRDESESRKAQKALLQEKQYISELFAMAPSMIFTLTPEGHMISANKEFCRVTGFSEGEIQGSSVLSLLFRDEQPGKEWLQLACQESQAGYLTNVWTKSGEERQVTFSTSKRSLDDGALIEIIAIGSDVTEQYKVERERRRLEEQIQHSQKLESLGVLAGGIAHDFNNLLVGMLGNAGLALEEIPLGGVAREHVKQIEIAATRASELTQQMLAYSGKGRFLVMPLDLSELVEEMTHLLEVSIPKNVVLSSLFAKGISAIHADASQVRQVVMNLIMNAADAIGEEHGTLKIRTGERFLNRDMLAEAYMAEDLSEGSYVFLEVEDSGCGMSEETRERVFDPFFTTKETGRGLGMAAVLGIIRGHRGAIRCESKQGKGTTFQAFFPTVKEKPVPVQRENFDTVDWEGRGTVLVVDDEKTVRNVARKILERQGFEVMTANDGLEGVEVFREWHQQIVFVLLDMAMPRMGGEEALRAMREIDDKARILLSSGYNETEMLNRFSENEFAGFIQKPYSAKQLVKSVWGVLPQT